MALVAGPLAKAEDAGTRDPGVVPAFAPEFVIVTATQRSSDVSDVPASVSVFAGAQIANSGIEDIKHLTSIDASLGSVNSIGESYGQVIRIRGIITSGADIGLESDVGITVDGVPLSRPNLAIAGLVGIDRVEILRGPQGTLFGKNTTAGAINVITRRPSFDPEFSATAGLGNLGRKELRISANDSLIPNTLAGRIDALYRTTDGYVQDSVTGRAYGGHEHEQARGQLLWTPNSGTQVRLIADYFHHDGTANAATYRVVGPTGALISSLSGVSLIPHPDAADVTQIDNDSPRFDRSTGAGLSVETDAETALGALTTIASYRTDDFARSFDIDNSPADLIRDTGDGERYGTVTMEARLQGRSGRWDHLIGTFFSHEFIESRDSYSFGTDFEAYANGLAGGLIPAVTGLPLGRNYPAGNGIKDVFHQQSSDFAIFTHNIYDVTDWLSLAAGLRFSTDRKTLRSRLATANPGCSAALALHGLALSGVPAGLQGMVCIPNLDPRYDGSYDASRDESNWSGVASLTGKIADNIDSYLSVSRGYKPGGFQLDRSGMNPAAPALSQVEFGSEKANSFEGGLRAASADGLWRADATAYWTIFDDYQFSYFTGLNRRTKNVPNLATKGIELETSYRPVAWLHLTSSLEYEEAVFGRSGFPPGLTQIEGSTAQTAPRWVVVGSALSETELPQFGMTAFAYADLRWQSKANVGGSASSSGAFIQDAYFLADARIGVATANAHWRIEAWARNLFNQHAWSVLNYTTLQPGSVSGYVIDPRTWGMTVSIDW